MNRTLALRAYSLSSNACYFECSLFLGEIASAFAGIVGVEAVAWCGSAAMQKVDDQLGAADTRKIAKEIAFEMWKVV